MVGYTDNAAWSGHLYKCDNVWLIRFGKVRCRIRRIPAGPVRCTWIELPPYDMQTGGCL